MKTRIGKAFSLSGIYSLGSLVEGIFGIVLIPLYTMVLTTADYGIIGLMSIIVNITTPLLRAPVSNGFDRFYYLSDDTTHRKKLFFNSMVLIGIQSLFLGVFFYLFNRNLASLILGKHELAPVVTVYSLIMFLNPLKLMVHSLILIQKRAGLYVTVSLARLVLGVGCILYWLFVAEMGVYALVYGALFQSAFDLFVLMPYIVRNSRLEIDLFSLKPLLKYGYPLLPVGISLYLLQTSDRYFIRAFESVSAVGLYTFAFQIASIINILLATPLKFALNPILFEIEKNPQKVKQTLNTAMRYFYIIALTGFLVISSFSREIVMVLAKKAEYWAAWKIVPILAMTSVMIGLRDLFAKGLVMAQKPSYISFSYLTALVVNLGLNVILVPAYGVAGAALGTLGSYTVLCIVSAYYSKRFYGLSFDLKPIIQVTMIAGLSFMIASVGNYYDGLTSWGLKFIGVFSFALILFSTGSVSKDDAIELGLINKQTLRS